MKRLFKKKNKQTCINCRFNCEDDHTVINDCNVGSYWAEKGLNRICYEGELWQPTEKDIEKQNKRIKNAMNILKKDDPEYYKELIKMTK